MPGRRPLGGAIDPKAYGARTGGPSHTAPRAIIRQSAIRGSRIGRFLERPWPGSHSVTDSIFPFPDILNGTRKAPLFTRLATSMMAGIQRTSAADLSQCAAFAHCFVRMKTSRPVDLSACRSGGFLIRRSCVRTPQSPSDASLFIQSTSGVLWLKRKLRCSTWIESGLQRAAIASARYGERFLSRKNLKRPSVARTCKPRERGSA